MPTAFYRSPQFTFHVVQPAMLQASHLEKTMKRICIALAMVVAMTAISYFATGCGNKSPVAPQTKTSTGVPDGYRVVYQDSTVQICWPSSTGDLPNFEVGMIDSTNRKTAPNQAQAAWISGTRLRYYWSSDHDFRIEYRTPRSCCYRVSYSYALYYALQMAHKPLIVYSIGTNADGSINWRIIVGGSAVQWISPISDWILAAQAEMQSYN